MKLQAEYRKWLYNKVSKVIIACIAIYQRILSPDHGLLRVFFPYGVCRFSPSCSEYTKQSVDRYGLRGVSMGVHQLLHCHPFAKKI